jgi:hypothetical protein
MTCTETRDRLPDLVYGRLERTTAEGLEAHLAQCPDCRRERAALSALRAALDQLPQPSVHVQLPRLYREAAERAARRSRRWRAVAVVVASAAALWLAFTVLGRLQVRLEAHQLTVRWGATEAADPLPPGSLPPSGSPDAEAHLRLLTELVHGLAADAEGRDRRTRDELAQIHRYLQRQRRELDVRFENVDRHLAAVDAVQVILSQKGAEE